GGRLATRRIGGATLDHGAQFFTVRSEAFGRAVEGWLAEGVVEEWCRGFGEGDGYPRYRVAGGMNRLAKRLAEGVPVVTRCRANAIIPGPDRWAVAYEAAAREPDEADSIIATPPVPQTLELLEAGATVLGGDTAEWLATMTYHKVIAVLTVLDRSPQLPFPGALQRPDHPVFSFVADNQAKGISEVPAVTFHLSHDLSARLWERDDDAILAAIADELATTLGPAKVIEMQIQRWRYAGPTRPDREASVLAATRPGALVLAGDGFGGSKLEGAFLSGLSAAERILATATGGIRGA
ncbi:MAG: FAD-dependent oxidoreductase, partial [Acidimicrobiales bacterium]